MYSHFDSKKIHADTPLTYELEVLECQPRLENIGSTRKRFFHQKAKGNVLHSALGSFSGDNTHDTNGTLLRKGGGPSKDYVEGVSAKAFKTN